MVFEIPLPRQGVGRVAPAKKGFFKFRNFTRTFATMPFAVRSIPLGARFACALLGK